MLQVFTGDILPGDILLGDISPVHRINLHVNVVYLIHTIRLLQYFTLKIIMSIELKVSTKISLHSTCINLRVRVYNAHCTCTVLRTLIQVNQM